MVVVRIRPTRCGTRDPWANQASYELVGASLGKEGAVACIVEENEGADDGHAHDEGEEIARVDNDHRAEDAQQPKSYDASSHRLAEINAISLTMLTQLLRFDEIRIFDCFRGGNCQGEIVGGLICYRHVK